MIVFALTSWGALALLACVGAYFAAMWKLISFCADQLQQALDAEFEEDCQLRVWDEARGWRDREGIPS